MDILILIGIFIFGTVLGSFLNVVILRFNTGKTIGGRSACMSCGKKLVWYELVPIISFLIQNGVCNKCKSKISRQYPLVEFLTGSLFVLMYLIFPPYSLHQIILLIIYLVVACLLIVISVYDAKHKIIPGSFVLAFIILSFVSLFINGDKIISLPSFDAFISGPALATPFALLWLASRGKWMGFGDIEIALGIGWFLGFGRGANAIILAFWIAAVISVLWLFITYKRFLPKKEVPFGPYLIIGMYLVLILEIKVIDFSILREIILSLF